MHSTSPESTRTLDALMRLDDAAFLSTAYLWLLGRPVDPAGFRDYDARLRAGTPRLQVVVELASSPEGAVRGSDLPGLAEAMAGFRPASQPAGLPSIRDLLRLENEQFVDMAATALLGGLPQQAERERWILRLRAGTPRMVLLGEMLDRRSGPTANLKGVEGLPVLISALQGGLCPVAFDIDELLRFDDEAFVDCAYKTLLGRRPDPLGLSNYVGLVRAGHAKMGIVARLLRSPEGRARDQTLPGLKAALLRYWMGRLPLIGRLARALWHVELEWPQERHQRALDNKLGRLLKDMAQQQYESEQAREAVDRLLGDGSPV